jgi:cytochrome c oxidase assembly protein Cox11
MISFRDKSFCNKDECAKTENCPDYFSDHLKKMAEKVGLPVSFIVDPPCYRRMKNAKPDTNTSL